MYVFLGGFGIDQPKGNLLSWQPFVVKYNADVNQITAMLNSSRRVSLRQVGTIQPKVLKVEGTSLV